MNIDKVISAFASDIETLIKAAFAMYGINNKVGKNTLLDSNLLKDLEIKPRYEGDLVVEFLLNNYITYVNSGRRKGAKMPPVKPIADWVKRHPEIDQSNSTIFLIRRAISRDGIAPRPIIKGIWDEVEKHWNSNWADELFDIIIENITKFFN